MRETATPCEGLRIIYLCLMMPIDKGLLGFSARAIEADHTRECRRFEPCIAQWRQDAPTLPPRMMRFPVMQNRRILFFLRRSFIVGLFLCHGCGDELIFRLPEPAVRYVAFGDSATEGPAPADYSEFLPGLLNIAPEAFAKEGSGGETTTEGLDRLQAILSLGIFPNAEVLLYWEGGNDLTDFLQTTDPFLLFSPDGQDFPFGPQLEAVLNEVQTRIESAISTGRGAGLRVYVATYFFLLAEADCDPLFLGILTAPQAANAETYVSRLNDRIRLAAANQGATLVDVAAADGPLRADSANYFNCNHLGASGNEIVAGLFRDAVAADLGQN